MKKTLLMLKASLLFISCSTKPKDFIGVYDFKIMAKTTTVDTTEIIRNFFQSTYLRIPVYKLTNFKYDIFEVGDKLQGTCSFTSESDYIPSRKTKESKQIKIDLKNIHLLKDTLIADLNLIKSVEIKFVKSESNLLLIMPKQIDEGLIETCNNFALIEKTRITYRSYTGSKQDVLDESKSNSCSVDNKIKELINNGYNKDKEKYLKDILLSKY